MSTSYIFLAGALFLFVIAIVILFMGKGNFPRGSRFKFQSISQDWFPETCLPSEGLRMKYGT